MNAALLDGCDLRLSLCPYDHFGARAWMSSITGLTFRLTWCKNEGVSWTWHAIRYRSPVHEGGNDGVGSMNGQRRPIDDYALAAFIVGKVPGGVREQILESLANGEDAQRILAIVYEALAAGGRPDDAMRFIADNWKPAA